jgi:hypothetical protein
MKKNLVFSAMLAALLALGLILGGCDMNGDSDDDGVDSALVAKWYLTQAYADAAGSSGLAYEFTSDGKVLVTGIDNGITCTTSGDKISTEYSGQSMGTADYAIDGTKLTLTNASATSGLVNGDYYKKAP